MSNDKYEVVKKYIEEIDFYLLVLRIPEDDLLDKLTYLAREKGQITKSFYEDFVIATCVANINQLLHHMNKMASSGLSIVSIKKKIMEAVIDVNPLLSPKVLVINQNYVIKIRPDGKLKKGEKPLTSNKHWSTNYYDEIEKVYDEEKKKKTPPEPPKPPKDEKGPKLPRESLKDIDELKTTFIKKWWKRIGQYVTIKKYNAKDEESILRSRFFHSRVSFLTFVVSVCVENFEDLFRLLDSMGVSNRVSPQILMKELYDLCKSENPFLTFENAQVLSDEDPSSKKKTKKGRSPYKTSSMTDYLKRESAKRFRDVSKESLLKLGTNMKKFLIGQDEAIDELVSAIQRASVGLKNPEKPIGSFLFAGRTGVGKTLASKVLAQELIQERDGIITVDCSEYTADHEYSKLIGAPAGYVGHESGGFLTNALAARPFSIVLFDEIEKASKKVHELLLQVLEEGRLTDGKGKSVSFGDAVIILTSNIGVEEVNRIGKTIGFGDVAKLTDEKKDAALDGALRKTFKPEFLNRLDNVIHFKTLTKADYLKIIELELNKLNEYLKANATEYSGVSLSFDSKVKNLIYKKGIDEEYGARPLKRYIETSVSTPLALKLLNTDIGRKSKVKVTAKSGEIVFEFENLKNEVSEEAPVCEKEMRLGV